MSQNYALTFRSPPNTMICALPDGWAGSDHGTVLFLTPPRRCAGTGYPSSDRGFSDNVPRIELYYEYWLQDVPGVGPPRCRHAVGTIKMMGHIRPLCRGQEAGLTRVSVAAPYDAGAPAWTEVALLTTRARMSGDLKTFRKMATSLRGCRISWQRNGKTGVYGEGDPCPTGRWF